MGEAVAVVARERGGVDARTALGDSARPVRVPSSERFLRSEEEALSNGCECVWKIFMRSLILEERRVAAARRMEPD